MHFKARIFHENKHITLIVVNCFDNYPKLTMVFYAETRLFDRIHPFSVTPTNDITVEVPI